MMWLGHILLVTGTAFCLVGAFGLLRMPTFIQRTHAASLVDSMGLILILTGLIFYSGWSLNGFKLLLIIAFTMITGSTAIHAITNLAAQNKEPLDSRQQEQK